MVLGKPGRNGAAVNQPSSGQPAIDSAALQKADSQIRAARIQARAAIVAALILGSIALLQFFWGQKPDEESAPKSVDEIISLDLESTIPATTQGVHVTGKLHHPLPSGQQLWSGQRDTDTAAGDDVFGPGFTVEQLCDILPDGKAFDCGFMQLGDDSYPTKQFAVYVGLADSTTAKELMKWRWEQDSAGNYNHTAPRGYKTPEEPELITRTP